MQKVQKESVWYQTRPSLRLSICVAELQTTRVRPGNQEKHGIHTKNHKSCGCCPEFFSVFPVSHGSNCFYKHAWEEHPGKDCLGIGLHVLGTTDDLHCPSSPWIPAAPDLLRFGPAGDPFSPAFCFLVLTSVYTWLRPLASSPVTRTPTTT